jgi:hypothetical protein
MKHFLYRLIPPRPTFHQDMTPDEKCLMEEHIAYWNNLLETWSVVAFGSVEDSAAGCGIAILETEEGADIEAFGKNDPLIKSQSGFHFTISPMPLIFVRS